MHNNFAIPKAKEMLYYLKSGFCAYIQIKYKLYELHKKAAGKRPAVV